jgi:hypothetical protein
LFFFPGKYNSLSCKEGK